MRKAHDNVVAKLNRLKEVDPRAASREEWIMLVMEPLYSRDLRRRIREKLATETPSVADFLETAEEFISREVRMSHADRVNPLNGNGNGKKSADGGKEAGKGGKGGPKKTGTTAGFAVTVAEAEAKVAACAATKPQNSSRTKSGGGKGRKKSFSSNPQKFKGECFVCKKPHWLSRCEKYSTASREEKKKILTKASRCWRCVRSRDQGKSDGKGLERHQCPETMKCKACGSTRHITLTHDLFPTA